MNSKSSIFTSCVAMCENTALGVHEWNEIRSYNENISVSFGFYLQ